MAEKKIIGYCKGVEVNTIIYNQKEKKRMLLKEKLEELKDYSHISINYLEILQACGENITSIMSHFDRFKEVTEPLIAEAKSDNCSDVKKHFILKLLTKLYIKDNWFVKMYNAHKRLPDLKLKPGDVRFKDNIFDNLGYLMIMPKPVFPYVDNSTFSKDWAKGTESEKKAYNLRFKYHKNLKKYNKYLDEMKNFLNENVSNFDKKVDLALKRLEKSYMRKHRAKVLGYGGAGGGGSYDMGPFGLGPGAFPPSCF
ncbi:MAG TPA: hypothetical protein DCO89_03515 [Clostridiales bacterium]|nr:hypothetical protein [Clostridiales bacterium]